MGRILSQITALPAGGAVSDNDAKAALVELAGIAEGLDARYTTVSIVDNGDGTDTVTVGGAASIVDNGNGTATLTVNGVSATVGSAGVSSVAGRSGAVVLASADLTDHASLVSTAALASAVATETTRAEAAESTLNSSIGAEVTRATAAEGARAATASNGSDFANVGTVRVNLGIGTLGDCAAVAVANLTLSGTQTIDGYAASAGDRILCTGQSTGSQNGPWTVQSSTWTRPADYPNSGAMTGRAVQVNQGSIYAGTVWLLTTIGVTVDTTATAWTLANRTYYDSRYAGIYPLTPKSGYYHYFNSTNSAGTGTQAGNTVRATAFWTDSPLTISALFAEFTVAGDIASVYHPGIWLDDGGGWPSALALDVPTLSTGTSNSGAVATGGTPGVYAIPLGSNFTFTPHTLYWVGGCPQTITVTSPTMRTVTPAVMRSDIHVPIGTSLPAAGAVIYGFQGANQTGALTTFGTVATTTTAPARLGYKVA